jgi:hypothetical protein
MEWKQLPYKYPKPDLNSDTVVRQSTINQIALCGYRKLLEGQEGYLDAVSEPMVYGSAVHYLIARHLELDDIPHHDIQNMEEWVEEMLVDDYGWSLDQVPNVRDFFSEVESSYAQWRTVVLPTLPPLITQEEEMWMYLGEGRTYEESTDRVNKIYLKGTPDAVFEGVVIDWKTSGRAWKETKAHKALQADLYMALVKQNLDVAIRDWIFWVYNRRGRVWEAIPTKRRISDINSSILRAYDYGLALGANILPATPFTDTFGELKRGWYCSAKYCGAWNICPAKYLHDDVNENAVAIRSWK